MVKVRESEKLVMLLLERAERVLREVLGEYCGVLVTDGYKVYERYCEQVNGLIHAQCWAHTRRKFFEAEQAAPEQVAWVLRRIGQLYRVEEEIREKDLDEIEKILYRREHSKPLLDEFFARLSDMLTEQVLLPSNRFTLAVNYALEREDALKVFLDFPNVPLDTNEVERSLRPIPMGRKAWLFSWTEVGAKYVGIVQSLIQTCRLQGVDPYVYLVDILQRIDTHPAIDVDLLTPRLWKENFS